MIAAAPACWSLHHHWFIRWPPALTFARLLTTCALRLLQLNASGGGSAKIISEDHLDTNTLGILRQLKAQAISSWWKEGHPGWTVFRWVGVVGVGVWA
jgi:hypothetical protein